MTDQKLQEKLQEKLNYHYSFFIPIDFQGEIYHVLPLQDQIPTIESVNYNKLDGLLEIVFDKTNLSKHKSKVSDYVFYTFDDQNSITSITIKIKDAIKAKRPTIQELTNKIKNIAYSEDPDDIQIESDSKRKFHFVKDIIKHGVPA